MTVLATSEVKERLEAGEIFRDGTWDPNNFWQAKYDLRMADDFMVVPDPMFPNGRRYKRGDRRREPIILDPGDVAFVSTMERLCMPWDLVGNIGPKFGIARKGLLVLTGFLIDPGFGQEQIDDEWSTKDDERLHFLLANLSRSRIVLRPGTEPIASVQFLPVEGVVERKPITSTSDIEDEFFSGDGPIHAGLAFFHELKTLQGDVQEQRTALEIVEQGTHQIVFFGVFLFMVTLLATATAWILGLIGSTDAVSSLENLNWPAAVAVIGVSGAAMVIFAAPIWWFASRRGSRRS